MGSIFTVFFNVLLLYEYECFAITYVCTLCECLVLVESRDRVRTLGLKLQMSMSHHVDAGNRTQSLWVSSQGS